MGCPGSLGPGFVFPPHRDPPGAWVLSPGKGVARATGIPTGTGLGSDRGRGCWEQWVPSLPLKSVYITQTVQDTAGSCGDTGDGPGRHSGVDRAPGEPGPLLPSSGPSALPAHPTLALLGPGTAAYIPPLPLSDAPLKSYLSSCSPLPPHPGLICLLPPTRCPPPASHLWSLPLPSLGPPSRPDSPSLPLQGGISALWVRPLRLSGQLFQLPVPQLPGFPHSSEFFVFVFS